MMIRSKSRCLMLVSLLCLMVSMQDRPSKASEAATGVQVSAERIQFTVAAIEEREGTQTTISEALIEGPPGIDFKVNVQDERFKMDARFLTDLVEPGQLNVRTKLNTRRAYGFSERNLPLFEEDAENQSLQVGFDEQIVLLPFGRGEGDKLKIEITPALVTQPTSNATGRRLAIRVLKQAPGGQISVEALKVPHRFDVEASLLWDGVEIAKGAAECLLEEPHEVKLTSSSTDASDLSNMIVQLSIDRFEKNRPLDNVWITFNADRTSESDSSKKIAVARNWEGVLGIGREVLYDLGDSSPNAGGHHLQLRFKIALAKGESAE